MESENQIVCIVTTPSMPNMNKFDDRGVDVN